MRFRHMLLDALALRDLQAPNILRQPSNSLANAGHPDSLCVPSGFQRKGRTMPDIFGKKQSEGKWHAIRNGESATCPEYLRLRQLYEAALRRWVQNNSLSGSELVGESARHATQVKQAASIERDAAKERFEVHKRSCAACIEAIRLSRTPPRG